MNTKNVKTKDTLDRNPYQNRLPDFVHTSKLPKVVATLGKVVGTLAGESGSP